MLMADFGELLVMLVIILIAAEVFTNALEHLGERLGISEGVTGSLFAAVGTAMPESMVPILAFFAGGSNPEINEEIRDLLIDCGQPLPALLAVIERHDAIEGCFDEESEGMLEVIPEPNLIIPFNGESEESLRGAFEVLATVCDTLSCATRLMNLMPGNERRN